MTSVLSTEILSQLQSKFASLPGEQLQQIAAEIFKVAPTQKPRRKTKDVPAEERCMARMWCQDTHDEDGNYVYGTPCQCSRRHKDGRFCGQHAKAFAENPKPLQFKHTGAKDYKRFGLFHGAIDEDLPIHDDEGRIVIYWNEDSVKKWVAAQKEAGTYTEHPAWTSAGGNLWLGGSGGKHGTKKGASAKTTKAKTSKAAALGVKQKRGLTPYFCFLAANRDTIKDELVLAEEAAAKSEGRTVETVRVGPITKEAGIRWKALKAKVGANDVAAVSEMEGYIASSDASKAKAAEENATAEAVAMGSLDDQIAAHAQKAKELQALKALQNDPDSSAAAPATMVAAPPMPPSASAMTITPKPVTKTPVTKLKLKAPTSHPSADDEDDGTNESKSSETEKVVTQAAEAEIFGEDSEVEEEEEKEEEEEGSTRL